MQSPFSHQNSDLKKKASEVELCANLTPKVTPNHLQNGPPGRHFPNFGWNRATLHPTQYLLCFSYILEVLGRLFFVNFVEKMGVDHEPYKTTLLELDFLEFYRKCTKIGTPKGGAKPPQIFSKSTFDCRGSPWGPLRSPRPPKWSQRVPK